MMLSFFLLSTAVTAVKQKIDLGWRFKLDPVTNCSQGDFPFNYNDKQCMGLTQKNGPTNADECSRTCCGTCEVWQWCPAGTDCNSPNTCWVGMKNNCQGGKGWVSRARDAIPTPIGSNCTVAECQRSTNDESWRTVDLPHDFVIEGTFSKEASDDSHGHLPYGSGWYRFHLHLVSSFRAKPIWLEFEGIQRAAEVYVNGVKVAAHSSGYTPFHVHIGAGSRFANLLNYEGQDNVIAVFADCTQPDGWWYDGGGIYRHVWLGYGDSVRIGHYGVYLPASVDKASIKQGSDKGLVGAGVVHASVNVVALTGVASQSARVQTIVYEGPKQIAEGSGKGTIKPGGEVTVTFDISIPTAKLWSPDSPTVYTAVTSIYLGDSTAATDTSTDNFGVRTLTWERETGLWINGVSYKVQGMANHQDFAGIGVAIPDNLQAYRVSKLQQMGTNAWRTAHNPPNPALLDATDALGMLVWDENHRNRAGGEWDTDLDALILRDRNHPSVIIWSLCNEVLCEDWNTTSARSLTDRIKRLDPLGQRVVSAAMNGGYDTAFGDILDVVGFNYNPWGYDQYYKKNPKWKFIGSETSSEFGDRGIYENDPVKAYVSAYDVNYPGWGASAEASWCDISSRKFMSGTFPWTGFDYKGEPTPYAWPNVNSHFGIIDIAGFPKDTFYYYQSQWAKKDMLHVFPHWNWNQVACTGRCVQDPAGNAIVNVWAYTNFDQVELFLNGKSLGVKDVAPCRHVEWNVTYAPGVIRAVAYQKGVIKVIDQRETTDAPVAISLTQEWPQQGGLDAANRDAALITAILVDSNGREVLTANANIDFTLEGPASIIGLGNGDPSSHEPDKPKSPNAGSRSAWNGLARVVIQANPTASSSNPSVATLTATSPGLKPVSIAIRIGA